MSSTTLDKRRNRVRRRGSPESVAALDAGKISIRTADTLFYLPLDQQRAELQRRVDVAARRERRSQLIAETIRGYLGTTKQVDLQELRRSIESALSAAV